MDPTWTESLERYTIQGEPARGCIGPEDVPARSNIDQRVYRGLVSTVLTSERMSEWWVWVGFEEAVGSGEEDEVFGRGDGRRPWITRYVCDVGFRLGVVYGC